MSTTLLVHYLPRGEYSNTKKLVDAFKASADGKTEIIEHDLIAHPPEMFLRDNLMAYVMRNMAGQNKPEYDQCLKNIDANVAEIKRASHLVIAFPMYNFSVPAVVKAWMDTVIIAGETFSMDPITHQFTPLLSGHALILSTAGGLGYVDGPMQAMDHGRTLVSHAMGFIGYKSVRVEVDGANAMAKDDYDQALNGAKQRINTVVDSWY
ncbi:NAD(P)H-dependent oxidoreductase [Candidatus Peregrinibacteria bacterium]|nr:MAG: NAD(P)H-dependent oxidoreductase [Candidatus Peregrinibacteria bacterium]